MIDWILSSSTPGFQALVAALFLLAIAATIWIGLLPHRICLARKGWTGISLALAIAFVLIALIGVGPIWIGLTSIVGETIPKPEPEDTILAFFANLTRNVPIALFYSLFTVVVWASSVALFFGVLSTAFLPRRDLAEPIGTHSANFPDSDHLTSREPELVDAPEVRDDEGQEVPR